MRRIFPWWASRPLDGRRGSISSSNRAPARRSRATFEARPEDSEDVMLVLRYFDAMNFAGMISYSTLIGLELHDPVVPAETVIANHLSGRISCNW
ncbi:MAG: acetylxylan esterase [Terrimicrobiaceae bacterium]